ncbi:AraC family transcriptional regulator [Sinorhizobium fredii]|uniref:AraC family transcriptional regulator n=1 Tax=Rhizobium fredii TaxID=380 RepID=A0A2A6M7K4_RHIFR|nr:AraC family transcriptional regulator [Sinorhizobium fredii]PDT50527.1 AraC family transcriptional regulator [Sinorhizobium fredii]
MHRGNSAGRADYIILDGSDPAELSTILSSSESRVIAKPATKSGIQFRCEFATADALAIGLCRYEGHINIDRESARDKYLVFLPRYGLATLHVGGREILTSPTRGAIFDCQQNKGIIMSGQREHLVVVLDRAALYTRLTDMLDIPVSGGIDFSPEINLTAGPGLAIAQTAAALHAGLAETAALRDAPLARLSLTNGLIELLLESLPHRLSSELHRATSPMPRHVKRAIDFMRANLSKPLTLQEIALAAGAGSRTLQEGFRRFKLTTPMAHLQYLRLDAVHQELMQARPNQTVSDIATRWGFTHPSRFAADYRKRFGQAPSQTLRSSRFPFRLLD